MVSTELNSDNKQVLSLGIVAGAGQLPLHLAKEAAGLGYKIFGVYHAGETLAGYTSLCAASCGVRLGQLGRIIKFFKENKVDRIIFAGGISRPNILKGEFWPDARGLKLLLKVGTVKDDFILRGIAAEFESEGIKVLSVGDILKKFVPGAGTLTKRALSAQENDDSRVGWEAAKIIGAADIGQTVVVSQGMVVAVEAVEGTDVTIKRGGELAAGRGGLVVKTCKPHQDQRLDLPTIGVSTIEGISKAGLTALVIEAGKSLVIDPEAVIKLANELGISIEVR
jgi:DUF1009 family protein